MMTRHPLIRFLSGRGADLLSGVIADLRSFGRKASLRMRISHLLAASEANNPGIRSHRIKIRPQHLTERPFLKQ